MTAFRLISRSWRVSWKAGILVNLHAIPTPVMVRTPHLSSVGEVREVSWNTGAAFHRVVSTLATPLVKPLGSTITEPPSGVGVGVGAIGGSSTFARLRILAAPFFA